MDSKNTSFEIIRDLLEFLDYNIENIDDLYSITIPQEKLKTEEIIKKYNDYKDNVKKIYNSSYLNCLHSNNLDKQKYPAVNMLRQVLRCENLHLYPFVIYKGYDKSGNKLKDRFYGIKNLE